MKKGSVIKGFINRLRDNKRLERTVYIVILLIAACIFLLSGGISCLRSKGSVPEETETQGRSSEDELEARLEAILSEIDGAGKVRVMITLERQTELAAEGGSGRAYSKTDLFGAFTGGDTQSSTSEATPAIRGVIIVAEGADSIRVKSALQNAAVTVLGTETIRISVFTMKK